MIHEQLLDPFIATILINEVVAQENTVGVGVDHEDRQASGVKQDGIGGLPTDALDGEQLLAKTRQRLIEKGLHIALVLVDDVVEQIF